MTVLEKGRYRSRVATTHEDVSAVQRLRSLVFRGGTLPDKDPFDADCTHFLVEDIRTGTVVCCFRLMLLSDGTTIDQSYSAQFYGLTALRAFEGRMVEMGRFCIHPDWTDADILRLAWGAMTAYFDAKSIEMIFGCSSFHGTLARDYYDAFALLRDRHLGPRQWRPQVKAPSVFRFASRLRRKPDLKRAQAKMPPLLRTYLTMGGWVSDHAVIDRDLGTLHVFTGLEIGAVPPSRARLLRALAGQPA